MTGQEIREKINKYYQEQEAISMDGFSSFVFNPDILNFNAKIRELQSICPHVKGENGKCIYCDKEITNG